MKKIQSVHLNRRDLLLSATCSASLAAVPFRAQAVKQLLPFVDLREAPVRLTAFADLDNARPLTRFGSEWRAGDLIVSLTNGLAGTAVSLSAPTLALTHLRLHWRVHHPEDILVLGDAWERSYGDLGWRNVVAERPLPWYCAVHQGGTTHFYGVETGAASFAMWQVDSEGITLWLDVRNGGNGLVLGSRVLKAATLVARRGDRGEPIHTALHAFCRMMCTSPRPPEEHHLRIE